MGLEMWGGVNFLGGASFLTNEDIERVVDLFHAKAVYDREGLEKQWDWTHWERLGDRLILDVLSKCFPPRPHPQPPSLPLAAAPPTRIPLGSIGANIPPSCVAPQPTDSTHVPKKRAPNSCTNCRSHGFPGLGHRRKYPNNLLLIVRKNA